METLILKGPGYKEEEIGAQCNKTYQGRNQRIHGGSYISYTPR